MRAVVSLCAAFLTTTICFFAIELCVRGSYDRVEQITGVTEWKTASWEGLTYFWDVYDPDYGWSNLPGYRSSAEVPFQIAINDQGLRADRNYDTSPQANIQRIAFMGDSCCFGEEVDNNQTVPYHIESSSPGTEVLNFGVHGFGLGQMVLRMEKEAFLFRPNHVVLLLLIPEDLARDAASFFVHAKPVFGIEGGRLRVTNHPVPQISTQSWWVKNSFAAAWLFGQQQRPSSAADMQAILEVTRALILRAKEQCDSRGVKLDVVLISTPWLLEEQRYNIVLQRQIEMVHTVIRGTGVNVVDLVPELDAQLEQKGDTLRAPIAHWSGEGNRVIADRIIEHLFEHP